MGATLSERSNRLYGKGWKSWFLNKTIRIILTCVNLCQSNRSAKNIVCFIGKCMKCVKMEWNELDVKSAWQEENIMKINY